MNITFTLFTTFIMVFLILNASAGLPAKAEETFSPYRNSTLGIEIGYPRGWNLVEGKTGVNFVMANSSLADGVRGHLRIEAYPLYDKPLASIINEKTNNTWVKDFELIENETADLKIIDNRNVSFKEHEARFLLYNITTREGDVMKEMSLIFGRNDTAYSISYSARPAYFDYYRPTIFDMLNSINFTTGPKPNVSDFSMYPDRTKEFKFLYPSNWKLKPVQSQGDDAILTEVSVESPKEDYFDPFPERIRIMVQNYAHVDPISANTSAITDRLLAYAKYWISLYPTHKTIQNISIIDGTLERYPAYVLNYTISPENLEFGLKVMTTFTVNANKVYLLQYSAQPENFDAYLPTVRKIIKSFDILESGS